jgi:hypothetical protein
VNWRLGGVGVYWWRGWLHRGRFADGRWHGHRHHGRVVDGTSTGRRDRVGPLAAVAPVGELVVMQATSQLSLFQMSCNVLIWHFLEAGLKKIDFLQFQSACHCQARHMFAYLILTPSSSSSCRSGLPILLNPKVVSIDGIDRRVVRLTDIGGSVHLVRWGRHDNC